MGASECFPKPDISGCILYCNFTLNRTGFCKLRDMPEREAEKEMTPQGTVSFSFIVSVFKGQQLSGPMYWI
jgi:hypothetical protein